ncbi:MAG: LemA family protein [Vicinamibacterales bacterium]
MSTITIVSLVLLALVGGLALSWYNLLVRGRNQVREAWSGVEVQLRRRASLIPNIVEAVRGYAQHERQTFDEVTRARGALQQAATAAETGAANQALGQALGRLMLVAENYPELRASDNFRHLHEELSDTEEKISFARQFYNRNVLDYNNRIDVFPTLLIARLFDFRSVEFFEADEEGKQEVRVAFGPQTTVTSSPPAPPTPTT